MAVEILILSGAKQGEQFVLDAREFTVGSNRECEVSFDPERDRAARGRSAHFCQQQDGWYLHCTGGEVLVNHQPVTGWTRVRSGDVVRMSESGPDFSFGIVEYSDGRAARPTVESGVPPAAVQSAGEAIEGGRSDAPPTAVASEPRFIPEATVPASANRPWALWAVSGLVLVVLVVLITRPTVIVIPPPGQSVPAGTTNPSGPSPVGQEKPETSQVNIAEKEISLEKTGKEREAAREKAPGADTGAPLRAQLKEAVLLLQVERAGRAWPHATCVAISSDTLLTSAREALQLAEFREKGFKIWVTRQATGFKEEVQDIRVNDVFATLAQKPNDWLDFSVGLLTLRGKLSKAVALVSSEELARMEKGIPVACFGFTHEGEEITRFDNFEPRLTQGKVKVIATSQDLPGRPRLLHVQAEIPKFAYGSPLVNAEGKLLGIYDEAAPPPGQKVNLDAPQLKNMHLFTPVDPEMINRWLQGRDTKLWPLVVIGQTSEKTKAF